MRYFYLFLVPLVLHATPFKVATYNVENLFDASYQGTEYDKYIPGKHNWNKRMVEIKLNHVAEVICDLDADILGLQEIENAVILEKLMTRLKKVGCGYRYSAITEKRGSPIQVAVFSRYALKKRKDIQVSHLPKVRNILEVEVNVKGVPLTLFVNHWKSKAYKGYESKRIKYAKALQSRITKLAPNKEYIILGDFNSDYNTPLTLSNKNNDTEGKTGFYDVLKTQQKEHEMLVAKRGEHFTLWREVAVEDRWSHKFYGKKSSLDHIVLPRQMFDTKGIDYVNNSFAVFKSNYLFTKKGYINRWRYKNGKHMAKGYSDHLPVYAFFDVRAYKADEQTFISGPPVKKSIEELYGIEFLKEEVVLENVKVILKRGRHAVVKQSPKGRGIFLFGCAGKLKEGHTYDLLVDAIKTYRGLKEVISVDVLKEKGKVDTHKYILTNIKNSKLKQNSIVSGIEGRYKNRHLVAGNLKIPIYFKQRKSAPKNDSRIKIHYAHIGYYKGLQLVIYSRKDFTVQEF